MQDRSFFLQFKGHQVSQSVLSWEPQSGSGRKGPVPVSGPTCCTKKDKLQS